MAKVFFLFISMFLFSACQNSDISEAKLINDTKPPLRYKPRIHKQTITKNEERIKLIEAESKAKERIAKIEAQKAMEIARLQAQKEQKIKELELKKTIDSNKAQTAIASTKAQSKIVITKEQQKNLLITQKENLKFYKQLTGVAVVLILLLLVFLYLLYRHKHALKLKLQEEQLKHEAYLLESKNHHERITKVLDIISDEKTDKNIKKELTKLLKDPSNTPPILLEDSANK